MAAEYILSVLNQWENAQAGTLISSLDPVVRQAAEAVMCTCRELRWIINRHDDPGVQADEANYAATSVIARLQKIYARKQVQQDSVACDNIRLAIRQLRRLIQPAPADNEPIDIFDI